MESNAYDRCANCHHEFADHDYVKDSIDQYRCPVPHQESGYGYFHGGDPRNFHPDHESCSANEIDNHRRACQLWDEAEARGETPEPEKCPSGWIYNEQTGEPIAHVLRAPYGIGGYTAEFEQFWEPRDATEPTDDERFGSIGPRGRFSIAKAADRGLDCIQLLPSKPSLIILIAGLTRIKPMIRLQT